MNGVLDEATETWVDLAEMLAADLPPCEMREGLGLRLWRRSIALGWMWGCRQPSVSVATLSCVACGRWRKAVCERHRGYLVRLIDAPDPREVCGRCSKNPLRVVRLS